MNKYTEQVCKFWKKYNSQHVTVDETNLLSLAKELQHIQPQIPDWQMPNILPQNPAAFISHNFFINAVNFAFTHFEPPYEKYRLESGHSGSEAFAAAFYRKFG